MRFRCVVADLRPNPNNEANVKPASTYENKVLQTPTENQGERVPKGQVDAEVRVRRVTDGPVPTIDIRTFRRSPAEVSADAFLPTAAGVTIEAQYAELLLEAIQKARAA